MGKAKRKEEQELSRVQRAKRPSKFRFYFLNILLGIAILLVMAAGFIVFFCRVQKVTVEGSVVNDPAVIQSYILDDEYSSNAVYDVVRHFFKPRKDIPFVASYKVTMKSLNHLLITVTEKERIGMLADEANGRYLYYDSEGTVTEIATIYLEDSVLIMGAVPGDAEVGKKLPIENTQRRSLLAIQKRLKQVDVNVSAINFMEDGTITMNYQSVIINLGTTANLTEKTKRLPYILPQLEGMNGTLHLEDWTEENTDIVFEKNM